MRILFVTFGLPYPPDIGVRIHDFYLIKNISRHHSVSLLSLITSPQQVEFLPELRQYCDHIDYVLKGRRPADKNIAEIARCFLNGRPLAAHPYFYSEMASKIRDVVTERNIDIVQIEHSLMSVYVEAIPAGSGCRTVLSFHNVAFNQYKRMAGMKISAGQRLLYRLKGLVMRRWETKYAKKFDKCIVVSPDEGRLLQTIAPDLDISVVENGVDTGLYKLLNNAPGNKTLLFVGTMQYPPNIDAVLYFCENIMPLIRRQIPDVKLIVAGHEPPPEIRRLAEQGNVIVTGYAPDLIPLYERSDVTVVPLRVGGGTRLKILESMALGRAVVSTSLGCEGLSVTDGENMMIADRPSEFAQCVIRLLRDKELKDKIVRNARHLVQTYYDWKIISGKLMALYDNM